MTTFIRADVPWPRRPIWRLVAVTYVALEGVLGAVAFSSVEARPGVEWTAFLLLLPGLVATFSVIYLGGAIAWSVPASSLWPVTVIYSLLFIGAAVANVCLLCVMAPALRGRRESVPPSR